MNITKQSKQNQVLLCLIIFALIQVPVAALFVDVLQEYKHNYLSQMHFGQYAFASFFCGIPVYVTWRFLLAPCYSSSIPFWALLTRIIISIIVLGLSVTCAIVAFQELHTDAQAALLFVFFPIYCAAIPFVCGFIISWLTEHIQ